MLLSKFRNWYRKQRIKKIQDLILPLINNPIARKYLGVPIDKKIVKVTANSVHYQKNSKEIVANFYVGEVIKNKGKKVIRTGTQVAMFLLALGIDKNLVLPLIGLTTNNYNVGVGDGYVNCSDYSGHPTQAMWDTAHDATIGTTASYGSSGNIHSEINIYGNANWITIWRGFFPIDTSELPDDTTISAAVLVGYIVGKIDNYNGDGYDYVAIVQTDQPDHTLLTTADYNNCGAINNPTKGSADIDISGLTISDWNNFPLNATGIGWISKTGWTMLGMREGHDIQDAYPGDPGEVDKLSQVSINDAGGIHPPYLSVTYSITTTVIETTRARIKQSGITKKETSRARIKIVGTSKALQSKGRIKTAGISKIVTVRAKIKATISDKKTQLRARVKQFGFSRYETSRGRIKQLATTKKETTRARIKTAGLSKLLQEKARIKRLGETKLSQSRARVKQSGTTRKFQSRGRIKSSGVSKLETTRGRVKQFGTTKIIQEKGRIKQTRTAYL